MSTQEIITINIAGAGLIIILLGLFRGPKIFFLAIFATKPFIDQTIGLRLIQFGGARIGPLDIIGALTFIVALLLYSSSHFKRRIKPFNENVIRIYLYFNVLVALRAFHDYGASPVYLLEIMIRISTGYLLYFIFSNYWDDERYIKKLLKAIWLSNFYAASISLLFYLLKAGNSDISQDVSRFAGFYGDSATLSLVALTSLVFGLVYKEMFFKNSTRRTSFKVHYYATICVALVIIWLSLTKATILACTAFLIIWFGMYKKRRRIILPLGVMGLIALFIYSEKMQYRFGTEINFFKRFNEIESVEQARGLGSGRFGRWIDGYEIYFEKYNNTERLFGTQSFFKTHNQYIGFLLQSGLIGFSIFTIIVCRFVNRLFRLVKTGNPLGWSALAMFTTILIYGLGYMSFTYTGILWITMILMSLINVYDGKKSAPRFLHA